MQLTGSSYNGTLSPDGNFVVFTTEASELNIPNCTACIATVRLDLKTEQWDSVIREIGGTRRIDVTPRAQQIGYSTASSAYRTCDPNSPLCHEAAVWDSTNRPYVVPLPACSGYPRPDTPASPASSQRGTYSVYLPITRNSCRAGHP